MGYYNGKTGTGILFMVSYRGITLYKFKKMVIPAFIQP
jgi:hypothetical protein